MQIAPVRRADVAGDLLLAPAEVVGDRDVGEEVEAVLVAERGAGLDEPRRIGRAIQLEVAAPSRAEAEARARQMCDKLLANPVTEDYLLQVEES